MSFLSNIFGPSKVDRENKAAVVREANDLSNKKNRPVATWDGRKKSKIKSNPFDTIGKRGGRKRRKSRSKRGGGHWSKIRKKTYQPKKRHPQDPYWFQHPERCVPSDGRYFDDNNDPMYIHEEEEQQPRWGGRKRRRTRRKRRKSRKKRRKSRRKRRR